MERSLRRLGDPCRYPFEEESMKQTTVLVFVAMNFFFLVGCGNNELPVTPTGVENVDLVPRDESNISQPKH